MLSLSFGFCFLFGYCGQNLSSFGSVWVCCRVIIVFANNFALVLFVCLLHSSFELYRAVTFSLFYLSFHVFYPRHFTGIETDACALIAANPVLKINLNITFRHQTWNKSFTPRRRSSFYDLLFCFVCFSSFFCQATNLELGHLIFSDGVLKFPDVQMSFSLFWTASKYSSSAPAAWYSHSAHFIFFYHVLRFCPLPLL